jgi:hypothetical protein
MSMLRNTFLTCGLALVLALAGPGWAQAPNPVSPDHTIMYRRAVALLDQAHQELQAGNIAAAKSQVNQSNSIFTLLQKEYASVLAERQLTPQEDQQLAINQKLADDSQAQADRLMAAADAKEKQGGELEAQGKTNAAASAHRESREAYMQVQNLSLKSAAYALRNQQLIFRFLAP